MSEVNYEALGRCDHLRGEIDKAHHERELAIISLNQMHRTNGAPNRVYNEVRKVNIDAMQEQLLKVKQIDENLSKLIEEHNAWAKQADKPLIKYAKF